MPGSIDQRQDFLQGPVFSGLLDFIAKSRQIACTEIAGTAFQAGCGADRPRQGAGEAALCEGRGLAAGLRKVDARGGGGAVLVDELEAHLDGVAGKRHYRGDGAVAAFHAARCKDDAVALLLADGAAGDALGGVEAS